MKHPKAVTFEITALVRSEAKAKALESTLGIKTVIGSLQDYGLLTENAEKAHLVVQVVRSIIVGCMHYSSRTERTGGRGL